MHNKLFQFHIQCVWIEYHSITVIHMVLNINKTECMLISVNHMGLNIDKPECMLLGTVQRLHGALKELSVDEGEYIITTVTPYKHFWLYIELLITLISCISALSM